MSPARRRFALLLALFSAFAASGLSAASGAPPPFQNDFFGFQVGEELRYVLGPPGELFGGESATWTIALAGVREEPGQPAVGVFDLAFERNAPVSVANERTVSMSSWRSNARAVINAYGFPLMVRIDAEVRSPGGRINYGADYEYDGDSFDATVTIDGLDADRNVNIPNHRRLDRDAPAGLFLFMPPSSVCLGANTTLEGWTGGECDGRFATFANPGLFSLIMPTLYEGGTGEGEFLVLMPNRSGRARANEREGWYITKRRTDVAAINRSSTLFERFSVKFEQRQAQSIELGPRTVDAWRLEADSPVEAIHVDSQGRVVRIDLEPQPDNQRRLHIRLLSRTEY